MGARPAYAAAAAAVGQHLAERGVELVYGGAAVGLMGVVADAVLAGGGRVSGVIPAGLATREVAHRGLTSLEVVPTMHARKARMAELSDAFIALPGGYGTLEEVFEIVTWAMLGIHDKPLALLDVEGYWTPLRAMLDAAIAEGFVRADLRALLADCDDPAAVLDVLAGVRMPAVRRWAELADS